jgi:HK97 family phage portal protein
MDLRAAWTALWGQKDSLAGPLVAMMNAGRPQATPRRYEKLAQEGYQKNVIVFRCVNLISESAAAIPWQLFSGKGDDKTLIEDHPILDMLARPNPWQGGASFFHMVYSFKLLSGNSYIEAVAPETGPNLGVPLELWTHRPERMKVIPSDSGQPGAYQFEANGRKVLWVVNPLDGKSLILHSKTFHPLNDWYGMSPLEAAAFEVDQHNAAGEWNFALLRNSGRPSGAFVFTPNKDGVTQNLKDDQFLRLKEMIDDSLSGPANAGRPYILEGGLDWRQIAMSPHDMDWLKGRDLSARDIAMAYDVPPQLVGIEGSQTFANFAQARLSLYEDAVLPLVDCYKDDLNYWLVPQFGDDLQLDYDEDAIPALAPRREAKWAQVKEADFLSTNEKRAELGFDLRDEPEADEILIPLGKVPLSSAGALPPPAPGKPPGDDDEDDADDAEEEEEADKLLAPPVGGFLPGQIEDIRRIGYGNPGSKAKSNGAAS